VDLASLVEMTMIVEASAYLGTVEREVIDADVVLFDKL
jgi:hypothetical protein